MNLQIVLKFVGCICIFSSSLLIGNTMEKKLKQRYLFFREMTAALSCLEKEMIHYRPGERFQYERRFPGRLF